MDFKTYVNDQKKYMHFDYPLRDESLFNRIKNEANFVASYRFLPYIRIDIPTYKFNGEKVKRKTRKITLASHGAALIYKVYSERLKSIYESYVETKSVNLVATAYRPSSLGIKRSNIHSAKEIFDFITESNNSYIIKGDFKAFFDSLNHQYLKHALTKVCDQPTLPDDWYAILKSLTKYKYIDGTELKTLIANENLKKEPAYFRNRKQFASFYHNSSIYFHSNHVGIPQGTALSALLANIYMLEFDIEVDKMVRKFGGIYRRYSDDFVIVLPGEKISKDDALNLKNTVIHKSLEMLSLTIEDTKTDFYCYVDHRLLGHDKNRKHMDYLGFRFTGDKVYLREKSIYKFSYRGKKAVKFLIRDYRDKKLAHLSDTEIDNLSFKIPKKSNGEIVGWKDAKEFHNEIRRNQIKLVRRKIQNKSKFRISRRNVERYLSENTSTNRSFSDYVSRAQEILTANNPNYSVEVLRQSRRRIAKNQRLFMQGKN